MPSPFLPRQFLPVLLPALLFATLLLSGPPSAHAEASHSGPILKLIGASPAPSPASENTAPPTALRAPLPPPVNFHSFDEVQNSQAGEAHELTLDFQAETTISRLSITDPEFKLVEGGSCAEGRHYAAGETCTVRVLFAPRGPGHRTGKLTVAHSAAAHPESIGLGGTNFAPAVSFVPSMISTVPATATYGVGNKKTLVPKPNLTAPVTLAVDGGDNLYISTLGSTSVSPEIYRIDSSGALDPFAGGGTIYPGNYVQASIIELLAPSGLAADPYGDLLVVDAGNNTGKNPTLREVDIDNFVETLTGQGSGCVLPCVANKSEVDGLQSVAVDSQENIFLGSYYSQEIELRSNMLYAYASVDAGLNLDQSVQLAVDANENLFISEQYDCQIRSANPSTHQIGAVVGSGLCGFSGDGGQARSAELNSPAQVAVDQANNLYIADSGNQVIRRVDATTGLIHTIAGSPGKPGFTGDGGPAIAATLNSPTGVAVDSNGNVYVADQTNGVVREIGPTGNLVFSSTLGVASPVQTIAVTNTGNSELNVTQAYWSGANTADFTTDPHTTTCPFPAAQTGILNPGQTCTIGILFNPSLVSAESTTLNFVDNTGLGLNTIQLNGTGLKKVPTLTWPKPASIQSDTPLSSNQLDATATYAGATVIGIYQYSPNYGATLTTGTHTLNVTFTPALSAIYSTVTGSVSIVVTPAPTVKKSATVTLASSGNPIPKPHPVTFSAALPAVKGVFPSGSVDFYCGTTKLGTGTLSNGQASLTVKSLPTGTNRIVAGYSGDEHFMPAKSTILEQKVLP